MLAEADDSLPERIAEAVVERLAGADLTTVGMLGAGIATRAFGIAAASGAWVIRVYNKYPEPWRWRGGRRYEVPLLIGLAACGLQVPRDPFAIEAEDGYPVAIVERKVIGRPLNMRHGASVPGGDRLAHQVAQFLTVLHRYPVSRARAIGVPTVDHGAESRELLADAAVSDPAYDFAKIGRELGSEFGSSLLRHYGRPGDASFQSRIDLYERLELLWQVARPDASDSERDASLRLLASLCEIGA